MEFTIEQRPQYSVKSLISIGLTVLLHLIIGYALVTGLARDVLNVITKPIETRIIEEVKIPPPPPPPPVAKVVEPPKFVKPPPAYVPPPEVHVEAPPQENTIVAVSVAPPEPSQPAVVAVVAPVAPAPFPVPARVVAKVVLHVPIEPGFGSRSSIQDKRCKKTSQAMCKFNSWSAAMARQKTSP